jgi:predicted RNA binding protein YcfA (HicA-like mRNA interferase family)
MTRLPVVSGAQAVRAFIKAGWEVRRRESSHVTLKRRGAVLILTVPDYKELDPWILRKLIRDAGLTVEQFRRLLED